ncbi:MAG TPA: hypothetical protein VF791_17255 [Pyrinomonadaceae bacterium]
MNRKTILTALSLIVLSAVVLAACGVSWQTLDKGAFKIDMPGTPKEQTQTIPTPAGPITAIMYSAEAKGEAFLVGYSDYPASLANTDPEMLFNAGRDNAMRSVSGKITSERSITLNGKPGKEFVGDATRPQEGTMTVRIYWVSPRIYTVIYIRPKGAAASENGEKFLNSFQLTGGK